MCTFQPSINPDAKLLKQINFLKIIFGLNLLIVLGHIIISINNKTNLSSSGSNIIIELFACLFLFMAIQCYNFVGAGVFVVFSLYCSVILFVEIGTFFQVVYLCGYNDTKNISVLYAKLGVDTFAFVFYVFAIIVIFPIYREMKAQYLDGIGRGGESSEQDYANRRNYEENDEERNNNVEPAPRRQPGFVPFSGRGVAVGGS